MNKVNQPFRSYLFVPANRVERFEKALNTSADAVIIDLEDAVPADLKVSARQSLEQWLINHPEHQVMIRINPRQTEWFKDDVKLAHLKMSWRLYYPKPNLLLTFNRYSMSANWIYIL